MYDGHCNNYKFSVSLLYHYFCRTGGGKGVIAIPEGNDHIIPDFRQKILADYGDFVTHLNGCFGN